MLIPADLEKLLRSGFQTKNTISSSSVMNFSFSGYTANNSLGTQLVFNPISDSIRVLVSGTGISENMNNEIAVTIYPNPNSGLFQITMDNAQLKSISQISIYNVIGDKIYSNDRKQITNNTTVDFIRSTKRHLFYSAKNE